SSRIPSWNSFLKDCASARPIKSAPIRANLNCCARAPPGHTIVAPPSSVMNSRRFTSNFSRASKPKIALRETHCIARFRRSLSRLWVRLRHWAMSAQCPVCPNADTVGRLGVHALNTYLRTALSKQLELRVGRLAARSLDWLVLEQRGFDVAQERGGLEHPQPPPPEPFPAP